MIFLYIFLSLIAAGLIYCFIETRLPVITQYSIDTQDKAPLLKGRRVLFLTDLHCTVLGRNNSRLYNLTDSRKVDAVFLCGDLVNGFDEAEFEYAAEVLRHFQDLKIPVYYTFGNHEMYFDLKTCFGTCKKYLDFCSDKCILLNNSCCDFFGASIYGFSPDVYAYRAHIENPAALVKSYFDKSASGKAFPEADGISEGLPDTATDGIFEVLPDAAKCSIPKELPDAAKYSILLAHDPTFTEAYGRMGFDLSLSGHLHGGIFRLPFIGGLISPRYKLFPKYDKGMYALHNQKNTHAIVSGGVGCHTLPFRFLNRPEVIFIEFQ